MGPLSTIKADNSITEFKNFNCQSVSVKTIYRAIDQGLIPGVARASLQTEETKIFSMDSFISLRIYVNDLTATMKMYLSS